MTWIADASLAPVAIWAAIALTGLATGMVASRWGDSRVPMSPLIDGLLLAGAAASVIAWSAITGGLLGAATPSAFQSAYVPIDIGPGFRLAVLWATIPGASLTIAATLLIWTALSSHGGAPAGTTDRSRFVGLMSAIALLALGVSAWFAPRAGAATSVIPTFVQSTPAALAPLFALLAIVGLYAAISLWLFYFTDSPQSVPFEYEIH